MVSGLRSADFTEAASENDPRRKIESALRATLVTFLAMHDNSLRVSSATLVIRLESAEADSA
jgi:hypothetical protein